MKQQTALKLKELCDAKKIEFSPVPEGISVDYDLTDDELREFVEIEYGQTQQSVVELFTAICKKAVKLAVDHAKTEV